ncbi:IntI1 integrase, partial [Salmonella enterica subsp. enterica serovar Newport str. SHSN013]
DDAVFFFFFFFFLSFFSASQSWRIHYPCAKAIGAASNGRLRKVLPASADGRQQPVVA